MSPRPARWSVLLPVGLALYAANHAIVLAIRRVAYDLDALLPAYAAVSLALTLWYAWLLCALREWRDDDGGGGLGAPGRGARLGLLSTVAALVVLHVWS